MEPQLLNHTLLFSLSNLLSLFFQEEPSTAAKGLLKETSSSFKTDDTNKFSLQPTGLWAGLSDCITSCSCYSIIINLKLSAFGATAILHISC